jgi:carboxypeptidase Taq
MAAVSKELGATDELLANGQFSELLVWLRRNVHCHGRRYSSRDLLRQATGEELSARPFLDYLSNKLLDVYGLA